MKSLCTLLLVSFMGMPALAQESATATQESAAKQKMKKKKTVDPSGTWRWTQENQDGESIDHQVIIQANKKNEVVGVYSGLIDDFKSKEGKIEGDHLKMKFVYEGGGTPIDVIYDAKIKGVEVVGTIVTGEQGEQSYEWKAKRTVELSDVVGTWKLDVTTPEGESHTPTFVVKKDGGDYVATYTSELGDFKVTDLKAKKNRFSFKVAGEIDGQSLTAEAVSMPKGDKLVGEILAKLGGDEATLEFTGKREKKK